MTTTDMQTKSNSTFEQWMNGVAAMWGMTASNLEADEWRPYYDAGYDHGEALEKIKAGDEP
ncbi:hypothetical protein D9623_33920 (plasmid) [Azospirillum brasilense]|uniref:Uncharacterized protein n=1 Tax=Azospirillum brasilense TaxID=192 RepID=A0A4D8QWH1_AZOBR|nr:MULTISPECIES: hypothetical protein [Azospirillum]YP_001686918.1 hypothetical protein APCd_gp77 [Azospirillum phage Cd]MDW7555441.1 hypothetical protein [Azospirillum brasilense]MDW7595151.1 hypothetical protein [Azospirillum brasilense]MDW7630304.1 hypothetical protein [Azospirillum brasilense]MDX5949672.1 hypothetical protein [Azospirillum brasilense]OPH16809.1 hypothetical protein FE89_02280 [Azospirillum brasilense]